MGRRLLRFMFIGTALFLGVFPVLASGQEKRCPPFQVVASIQADGTPLCVPMTESSSASSPDAAKRRGFPRLSSGGGHGDATGDKLARRKAYFATLEPYFKTVGPQEYDIHIAALVMDSEGHVASSIRILPKVGDGDQSVYRVVGIALHSPYRRMGLRSGDTVIEMNGEPVADLSRMRQILSEFQENSTRTLTIKRRGQELDITQHILSADAWVTKHGPVPELIVKEVPLVQAEQSDDAHLIHVVFEKTGPKNSDLLLSSFSSQKPMEWMESSRVIPYYKSDGSGQSPQVIGFRFLGVRRGSLARAMGIRNGDIVRAMDDVPVDQFSRLMEVFEPPEAPRIRRLLVDRKKRSLTLTIHLLSDDEWRAKYGEISSDAPGATAVDDDPNLETGGAQE